MTHNNWEDLWLTEGFSTAVGYYGINRVWSFQGIVDTEAYIGNFTMYWQLVYGSQNITYSTLHPVLQGANPIDAFSNL